MLDKTHKLLELKTTALVDSLFVWNYKTNFKWRWIEFATYKEYDFSDNVRNIDFIRSDREGKILVKLYEEERELSVYFIVDLNETFFNSWLKNEKIDLVYEILYLIWFSAIKNWDKVGAFIFNWKEHNISVAKKWKQNFINIVNFVDKFRESESSNTKFLDLFKNNKKVSDNSDIKTWLSYFNSLRIKNSLVIYISDNLDIDKKDLKILWVKNDFIFCNVFNSFENSLNWDWISWLKKWNDNIFLDLDNQDKLNKYRELRMIKINELKNFVLKNWWRYILLDETKHIYKEFYKIF